jgi:opacity protein-like surface antigen
MGKIVKTLFLVLLLSQNAFAKNVVFDDFYLKKGLSLNSIQKKKIANENYNGHDKFKVFVPSFEYAIGTKIQDFYNTRLEFSIHHLFETNSKETTISKYSNDKFLIDHEYQNTGAYISSYMDFYMTKGLSVNVGGGIGIIVNREKASGVVVNTENDIESQVLENVPAKERLNFSFKLLTGISYYFNDNFAADLTGAYIYFGKNKPHVIDNINCTNKRKYDSKSIVLTLRHKI